MVGDIIKVVDYLESRSERLKASSRGKRQRNAEFLLTVSNLLVSVAASNSERSGTAARAELEAYLSAPPGAFLSAVGKEEAKRLQSILLELTEDEEVASRELLQAAGRLKALSTQVSFAEEEGSRPRSSKRIVVGAALAAAAALVLAAVFLLILF